MADGKVVNRETAARAAASPSERSKAAPPEAAPPTRRGEMGVEAIRSGTQSGTEPDEIDDERFGRAANPEFRLQELLNPAEKSFS
ncbi:hypothetical protein [Actinocrispum wychmicini]|uniref:hypothetical protein n=1 Tax=Actinocrispum wychmicini TaxID=1213861 RepID=UPI0010443E14|nr:hypothetical protein [Actinocrispum wychmicini]